MLHVCVWNVVSRMEIDLLLAELEGKALLAGTVMMEAHRFHVQHISVEGYSLVQVSDCQDKVIKAADLHGIYILPHSTQMA